MSFKSCPSMQPDCSKTWKTKCSRDMAIPTCTFSQACYLSFKIPWLETPSSLDTLNLLIAFKIPYACAHFLLAVFSHYYFSLLICQFLSTTLSLFCSVLLNKAFCIIHTDSEFLCTWLLYFLLSESFHKAHLNHVAEIKPQDL